MKEARKFRRDKKREARRITTADIFSPVDNRDYLASDMLATAEAPLPDEYRTEGKAAVLQQGVVGSCVAHAIATAMAYGEFKAGFKSADDFSRGYIYANREDGGEGMYVRDGIKGVNHSGDCLYPTFPWNARYEEVRAKLLKNKGKYDAEAVKYKVVNYFQCKTAEEIKRALIACGAVVFAMPVYSKFGKETKAPEETESYTGNHCMCLVGWDKTGWIVQNSWGPLWGNGGYCHISYDYPVREWWGITVNKDIEEPKKPSIWTTIGNWFRSVFEIIANWFKGIGK